MKILSLLILATLLLSCVSETETREKAAANKYHSGGLVIPIDGVLTVDQNPILVPGPVAAKVELSFDVRRVPYDQVFVIVVQNKSKLRAELNMETLKLTSFKGGKNFIANTAAILDSGCSRALLILEPNAGCAVTIKNGVALALPPSSVVNLSASLDMKYDGNTEVTTESSLANTSQASDEFITLLGP